MGIRQRFASVLSIDLRALACFRFVLATLVLLDLSVRAMSLRAHYTDAGVLPRSIYLAKFARPEYWSLHLINGSLGFQVILFGCSAILAMGMLVGYRTKLCAFGTWLLLVSLQTRNPMILNSGDVLLRLLLFWCLFLPIGARYALDARSTSIPTPGNQRHLSIASAALLLQVAFVYVFTAILKDHPIWRSEYTSVYYALQIDHFATRPAKLLLHYPAVMKALSFASFYWEAIGPVLAFLPIAINRIRPLVAIGFMGFHLGLALCLHIGLFPYVSMASWIVFLPPAFWDGLERKLGLASQMGGDGVTHSWRQPALVAKEAAALFFLCYIFVWNLHGLFPDLGLMPKELRSVARMTRVDQRWAMFAPHPLKNDGWFVIDAQRSDGSRVDPFRNYQPVRYEKPTHVADDYASHRWRKYMMNLFQRRFKEQRKYYSRYLCREANAHQTSEERITSLDLVYMLERTRENETKPVRRVVMWTQHCDQPGRSRSVPVLPPNGLAQL